MFAGRGMPATFLAGAMMEILTLLSIGVANGCLYALVGLGLVLVYNAQGIPNFAHGELFMAGAFIGYTAHILLGLPYSLSLAIAVIGGALIGMLVELIAIRPISARQSLSREHLEVALVMATVGLLIIIKGLARIPWGDGVRNFPQVFSVDSFNLFGIVISSQHLLIVAVTLGLTPLMFAFFRFASLGKKMRATEQNRMGAQLVGINIGNVYAATWALASACGAIAGILAAPLIFLHPDMGTKMLLKGFAAAALGGFGSVPGVFIGGILMGVSEILFGRYVSTALLDIFAFLMIMFVLLVRPKGLFGARRAVRV
jgi:branched-chain amino acid transport system permease protein